MHNTPKRVREPVQVYTEPDDKALLDQLAAETSLSRAELLRRGLRRIAADLRGARATNTTRKPWPWRCGRGAD